MNTLILYYTRSHKTSEIVEVLADELDAEVAELDDGKDYSGLKGWVTASYRSMKKKPVRVRRPSTTMPLYSYDQVIIAAPIWAETWCAVAKGFLAAYGCQLPERVHFVFTHMSTLDYEKVAVKMDQYLPVPHSELLTVSTKKGSYWKALREFIEKVK